MPHAWRWVDVRRASSERISCTLDPSPRRVLRNGIDGDSEMDELVFGTDVSRETDRPVTSGRGTSGPCHPCVPRETESRAGSWRSVGT